MFTFEILNLVNSQNGYLTINQIENIIKSSPQVWGIILTQNKLYEYSFWTKDNYEPIYFNIQKNDQNH